MADRYVSVPMILSDLERRDVRNQIFQADRRKYTRAVSPRTNKIGRVTHVGRGETEQNRRFSFLTDTTQTSCARGDTICPAPLLTPWAPKRLPHRRTDAT